MNIVLPKRLVCLPADGAAETPLTRVHEVQAVVVYMEADQVAVQQTLQYLVTPGQDLQDVPGREGDVQKECNFALDVLLFSHLNSI